MTEDIPIHKKAKHYAEQFAFSNSWKELNKDINNKKFYSAQIQINELKKVGMSSIRKLDHLTAVLYRQHNVQILYSEDKKNGQI